MLVVNVRDSDVLSGLHRAGLLMKVISSSHYRCRYSAGALAVFCRQSQALEGENYTDGQQNTDLLQDEFENVGTIER